MTESDWIEVRVYFKDGTNTLLVIHTDESIQDAIVEDCELSGQDMNDVTHYAIVND